MLAGKQNTILDEIQVEKLVYGGEGLARREGKVVLAPFVLPGEKVRVAPRQETASLVRARLVEILQPSPGRVAPPCPHFMRCGGCDYQHAGYEFQLAQKQAILREVLRRVGKMDVAEVAVVAGPPFEYRNRTQWHIAGGRIGYFQARSHRLCAIERCPISSPRINEALAALRRMIRQPRFPQFIRALEIFTDEEQVQINVLETSGQRLARTFFEWCASKIPGRHVSTLDYAAAGETFRVSHNSFFQANRFLTGKLVEIALEDLAGESGVDLYAGVGLFSLAMARKLTRVEAVESTRSAAADLEFNAARAGLPITVHQKSAEQFLERLETPPDFLLADPPRAGLGKAVVAHLLRLKPRRLTLVSCDPATLARDLKALIEGGCMLERITLIDLFPQTYHIESVARLRCG
jgi:23S rRNA (uracil1939-C5)-methyltransferase